jgi:ABC-type sulfate transport system substrate-binding protein
MFSTAPSRVAAARVFDDEELEVAKTITLTNIAYDSRAVYVKDYNAEIRKDKGAKKGARIEIGSLTIQYR